MTKIAVDAVLLPCREVAVRAIEANRELQKQCPGKIVLHEDSCLPHISLAMGCINKDDVAPTEGVLQKLAENYGPGALINAGIRVGTNSAGEKVSVLALGRTQTLQLLHEMVMRELEPYLSHDVTAEMVLSPPAASESTLSWIRDYRQNSSFERFLPHITLGYGQLDDFSFPPEIAVSKLALCHLGDHCTCRKILASAEFLA